MNPATLLALADAAEPVERLRGLQNVYDGNGFEISLIGMTIVFTSLVLISVTISLLPHILESLKGILPPEHEGHGHGHALPTPAADDAAVVAAIGLALHRRERGD